MNTLVSFLNNYQYYILGIGIVITFLYGLYENYNKKEDQ